MSGQQQGGRQGWAPWVGEGAPLGALQAPGQPCSHCCHLRREGGGGLGPSPVCSCSSWSCHLGQIQARSQDGLGDSLPCPTRPAPGGPHRLGHHHVPRAQPRADTPETPGPQTPAVLSLPDTLEESGAVAPGTPSALPRAWPRTLGETRMRAGAFALARPGPALSTHWSSRESHVVGRTLAAPSAGRETGLRGNHIVQWCVQLAGGSGGWYLGGSSGWRRNRRAARAAWDACEEGKGINDPPPCAGLGRKRTQRTILEHLPVALWPCGPARQRRPPPPRLKPGSLGRSL